MTTADHDALARDDPDALARRRLRERQGAGARYDAASAPADHLLLARRGTAFFARILNGLTDAELDAPSDVPGWSRAHVVAHVGYHARALARLVEAARQGAAEECLAEPEAQVEDVDFGATLPRHALRYLFRHSATHLDVEWRDLDDAGWARTVRSLSGADVAIATTPLARAHEIWARAAELEGKGRSPVPDRTD